MSIMNIGVSRIFVKDASMRDNFAQKAALTFKVKVLRSLELVSEDVDHGDSL